MSKARKKPAKKKPTKAKAPKKVTRKKVAKTQPKKAKKVTRKKVAKKQPKKAKEKKIAKKVTRKKVAKTKPKKAKKKKTAKKAAKPKAKTKVKSAKKKSTVKRATIKKSDEFDGLEYLVNSEDKRLGVKIARVRKAVSVDKIDDFCQGILLRDSRMFQSLKHQIARRGEMLGRIQSFADRLKKSLGKQISINIFLSDHDEVCMRTAFKPNKGQHPFDGDPVVADAFKTSGLSRLMSLDGTATAVRGGKAGVRDHDFSEKKWEFVEPEAAVA